MKRPGAVALAVILAFCMIASWQGDALAKTIERKLKLCFTKTSETNLKGVVSRKVWPSGSTLKIVFLDGDPELQSKVAEVAREWTKYANLTFEFYGPSEAPADSDVRVSFEYAGYWSYMGPGRRNPNKPTVSLETLGSEPDNEIQRVTLHEFGHVLGLYHEHQNPQANIQWNRDAVYEYFEQKQGWPRKLVDQEYLNPVNTNQVAYSTPFDPQSVMCYRVSPEFNADGILIDYNESLSEMDKAVIGRLYPR